MRIRPMCVIAMLTWGLTYGAGGAGAQGYPNFAPNGYPPGYGPIPPLPGMGAPPSSFGYPNPGFYAPPPGAVPNPYYPAVPAQPAFPGFAAYPGSEVPPVPTIPVGTAAAGNGAAPTQDSGGPTETLKNLPTPLAQPAPTTPAPAAPAPAAPQTTQSAPVVPQLPTVPMVPSEPMISYVPNGFLQPFNDALLPANPVPVRVTPYNAWATFQYLMGFGRPEHLPAPLVTTGSPTDLHPGGLGQPGTSILVGSPINFGMQSGFRINAGMFLDNNGRFSIEGDALDYLPSHRHYGFQSDQGGNPVIARPIFNILTGQEQVLLSAFPGIVGPLFVGGTAVDAQSTLYGFEVNGRYHFLICPGLRGDFLLGFRNLHLTEYLNIADSLTPGPGAGVTFLGNPIPAGSQVTDVDSFRTRNTLYAFQLGGRVSWDCTNWCFLTGYAKVALGPNVQTSIINGTSALIDTSGITTAQGGVLALPSNSGTFRQTVFSVAPEFGLNFGLNLTPNIRLMAGYSILMWSQVIRPGGQVPHEINPSQIPTSGSFSTGGPVAPAFSFNSELFWIQNINLGVSFRF